MTDLIKRIWAAIKQFFVRYVCGRQIGSVDIGHLKDYEMGIDHRWRETYGFWVVRNQRGLFVIMEGEPQLWAWPLVRVRVWCDDDGRLWVDLRQKFQYEKDEWRDPESFVRLSRKRQHRVSESVENDD